MTELLGKGDEISRQLSAFFTSAMIFASAEHALLSVTFYCHIHCFNAVGKRAEVRIIKFAGLAYALMRRNDEAILAVVKSPRSG